MLDTPPTHLFLSSVILSYFVFRDSGPDETRVKAYLPKEKQFLYTKNGENKWSDVS